jgi:hypothetical protein
MKNQSTILSLIATVLLYFVAFANSVQAQHPIENWVKMAGAHAQLITAQASMVTAQSLTITAQANAKKIDAEARQINQQTEGLTLDNSRKKAEVFYAKRALHDNYQGLAKSQSEGSESNQDQTQAPERLTSLQIDVNRKKVNWPQALQENQFSEYRFQLEDIIFNRADYVDQNIEQEVQNLTKEMGDKLRFSVHEVSPMEYIKARKFIASLARESQFPLSIQGLASN